MPISTRNKDIQILLLQQSIEMLSAWFSKSQHIKWFTYKLDIPEFIYEILSSKILYMSTQIRLQNISDKTWVEVSKLRKMLRDYTITELQSCRIRRWKVVVTKELVVDDTTMDKFLINSTRN